ncbi:5'/3'-nucleotidase SurE [Haloferax sp. Atlit-10N]|uniref:5'-nucleotidase SurE n=1 Tax=Haloferax prahovense (strain DSM 18310 / JCM 13924 / TL6) TaxID=1227461 RepID=M0GHQ6_HALPT|nr:MULTISPECIES: 5'/3'-nucleotidase SurE [Haloferax]ELZ71750.1 acid phosphatase [Haloferax prahovense DSM 18310]MCO8268701.1 5'/3'-nucleotidase SurE [Haloferax sp. AB510]RDZ45688.1 5'/3'-nucleotidase SurE [Haloferax sp. Atlit-19N]RDZ47040.1 5'/3'-nucleotidase SurE [Haloferax sp. Atlit-16N]RDZ60871.1 5'/3'-nucleotidase SurE [Haloferax sp. Atlit-10N]
MSEPSILLTNDDGIESVGFRALYDALSEFADVTAVAPATDQSAVGRKMSTDAVVTEHELGYALEGTPADCTVAGLEALCPDVDMVVSGINKGANIGAYVLGRSGTVSAAVEAAFFDVPAIALSLYVPAGGDLPWHEKATDPRDFREATHAASYLVKHAEPAGVFDQCDYLNVNAPMRDPSGDPADMQVTVPSELYDMTAEFENGTVKLHDRVWERMRTGDIPDPDGTDRRAVVEGRVSVSPLTAPHTTHRHEALDALAETYLE